MDVQRLAAFTLDGQGGNPAGVVIGDTLPNADDMQQIAADVGYSETVFAARTGDTFRTRYFAPEAEVPFCGHATIALGAALGAAFGQGTYALALNDAHISVTAFREEEAWGARLVSPATSHTPVAADALDEALALFGWTRDDLDPAIGAALVNGGAQHLLIPVKTHDLLREMQYGFDQGAALMRRLDVVTINLIWRDAPERIYSRNPFAGHGVYEDPATGAAAAALAGYLRDTGVQTCAFEVRQGAEMGRASRLLVTPHAGTRASVDIAGLTTPIV